MSFSTLFGITPAKPQQHYPFNREKLYEDAGVTPKSTSEKVSEFVQAAFSQISSLFNR